MNDLLMYNIVPVFPNHEDFAISEILRQHSEVGLNRFLISLSFHPQTTPARALIPVLCERFRRVRDGIAGHGIELGILVQSVLGHGWNGKMPLTLETWQHVVKIDGAEDPRMCLLDPGFREYVREVITAVASEGPSVILMDDDVGIRLGECFCPLHLAEINKATGRAFTREELAGHLQNHSADDPVSIAVTDVLQKSVNDFCALIRSAIDTVDPSLRCGLCACWPGFWLLNDAVHALAGNNRPFMRVNNAVYGDSPAANLVHAFRGTRRVIYQLDAVEDVIDEADTFPQNYMSESAALFHSHITCGLLSGLRGCKLWTSEFQQPVHTGSQYRYEARLRDYAGFYGKLPELIDGIRWQGLSGVVVRPRKGIGGNPYHTPEGIYPKHWNTPIEAVYALPLRYDGLETDGLFTLREEDVNAMTDAQIELLLAKKVIVDSLAARKLTERGFAPLIGVTADAGDDAFYFTTEISADGKYNIGFMPDDTCSFLRPFGNATETLASFCRGTRYVDTVPYSPSVTLFTNRLGGRIAVLGWHLDLIYHKMFRPVRRELLLAVADRVNGAPVEMAIESGEQELVRHGIMKDGSELLAVTRLSLDADASLPVRMTRTPRTVAKLLPNGNWETVAFSRKNAMTVDVGVPVVCCEPVVLKFNF